MSGEEGRSEHSGGPGRLTLRGLGGKKRTWMNRGEDGGSKLLFYGVDLSFRFLSEVLHP